MRTAMQDQFRAFRPEHFVTVKLTDLKAAHPEGVRPIDIAEAIIKASGEGSKPVNFQLPSKLEYWSEWAMANGRILDEAIDHLGYLRAFRTNNEQDGRYYLVQRKFETQ